jgi:ribosome biogenesis GTPase A
MNIQWYPGHMTKTRRMIAEQIKNVDAVCEILDARIPISSRNPDVDELTAGKPRMVVLNRVDQADPEGTKRWAEHFKAKGYAVLESDAKSGVGTAKFAGAVRELLADKLRAYAERGMTGGAGDDFGNPQCREIHVYQQGGRPQDRKDGGPSRRHPLETVGPH